MAELVIAHFTTQFDANAAAEKLISRGMQRAQIVLTFNESIGHSPASSTAPTSVVSRVSHRAQAGVDREKQPHSKRSFSDRTPLHVPDPALIGHTTMAVELRGEMTVEALRALLESAGADTVGHSEKHARIPEDPAMWPSLGRASREDIERSIRASREGARMKARYDH